MVMIPNQKVSKGRTGPGSKGPQRGLKGDLTTAWPGPRRELGPSRAGYACVGTWTTSFFHGLVGGWAFQKAAKLSPCIVTKPKAKNGIKPRRLICPQGSCLCGEAPQAGGRASL